MNTTSSIRDVIEELQKAENRYNNILEQYNSLLDNYTDLKSIGNKKEADAVSAQMKQLITALGSELNEMKRILNQAYNDGQTRQSLSASAGNALEVQDAIMEQRMNHYREARDRLAHVVGEEQSSGTNVIKNRNIYIIHYVFAIALIASIGYMLMGGSLPVGILIIMIVIGSYVSWEYYKFVIGETTAKISEASYGSSLPSVTGVFRLVT
jgi:uncharacterized protein YdcH (DUF465 family)